MVQYEVVLESGLMAGHAYSITDVRMVTCRAPSGKVGRVPLLRLRNPWGSAVEWRGAFSDGCGCISLTFIVARRVLCLPGPPSGRV